MRELEEEFPGETAVSGLKARNLVVRVGLKPCPFCGKDMQRLYDGDVKKVWCARCGGQGANGRDKSSAYKMWNLRKLEDSLQQSISELEAENSELRNLNHMLKAESGQG